MDALAQLLGRASLYFLEGGNAYFIQAYKLGSANSLETLTVTFPRTLRIRDFYVNLSEADAELRDLRVAGETAYDLQTDPGGNTPAAPVNPFARTIPMAFHQNGLLTRYVVGAQDAVQIRWQNGGQGAYCTFWAECYEPDSPSAWWDKFVRKTLDPIVPDWLREAQDGWRSPVAELRRRFTRSDLEDR